MIRNKRESEYSVSEKVIYSAHYFILKVLKPIRYYLRRLSHNTPGDDFVDRPIRRFGFKMFVSAIMIAYVAWSALVIYSGTTKPDGVLGEFLNFTHDIYRFHRNYVFDDPSTFTTLTIGISAGAIAISTFASSGIMGKTRISTADREGIKKVAIAFGSVATLVFLMQLLVCSGWFFWDDPSRGGLSPVIVADCLLGFVVCASMASLISMPSSHLKSEVSRLDREIFAIDTVVCNIGMKRLRYPLWNVRNLYSSLVLVIGWTFTSLALTPLDEDAQFDASAFVLATALMSIICGYIYFQFVTDESRAKSPLYRFGVLNLFLLVAIALLFSLSIASFFATGGGNVLYIELLAVWFVSFVIPLYIVRLKVIKIKILQGRVNGLLRRSRQLKTSRRRIAASLSAR